MSISLSRYVNITTSVGAAPGISTRSLIGRLFTGSSLLAPNSFLEFTSAADVATYFGQYSEEYYRALFYFSWISKNMLSPTAIQFASYKASAVAPMIIPAPTTVVQDLTAWQAISDGSFGLTIGATSHAFSSTDFTGALSLSDVAGVLQTKIRTASGTQWTAATVTYSNNNFYFVGGDNSVVATISVQPGATGTDITGATPANPTNLYWYPGAGYDNNIFSKTTFLANALWLAGGPAVSITQTLTNSASVSNNFGSFLFLNNLAFDLADVEEAAAWNAAAAQNITFLYTVPVIAANVSSWLAGLAGYEGTTVTLSQTPIVQTGILVNTSTTVTGLNNATTVLQVGMPVSGTDIAAGTVIKQILTDNSIVLSLAATGSTSSALTFGTVQFPEQVPMMIEAATNYLGTNTVQNYMFQVFDPYLTALVTDDSTATSYDALNLNYYGQTQSAGTQFNFYQRGVMQGNDTAPLDQNTYVNEIWLKDAISTAFINALLSLTQIPANMYGNSIALNIIQGPINQALLNGTISVGKKLSTAQISFITSISNDPNAWFQVQNAGYWVDTVVQLIPATTNYEIVYTLIYSKDDVIRFVSGSDILI